MSIYKNNIVLVEGKPYPVVTAVTVLTQPDLGVHI